jgi:nanoRNase/pAp phosphatase (c-di-AMP/oligoRNAs hydrolase)
MLGLEQQIFRQLEKAKNILIVFPSEGDGDALGAALGLFLFLKKLGQTADLAGFKKEDGPHPLSFLPGYESIQTSLSNLRRFVVALNISQAKVSQIKYAVDGDQLNFIISPASGWFRPEDVTTRAGEFKYDLIVGIGAADLESLGRLYDDNVEFFYKTTIINIDRRPTNEEFGQINFVDLNAAALAEIVFYLLKNWKEEFITAEAATCLLAGIIQATKNFKTPNLTPRTLLSASELITHGAEREEIVSRLYRSRDIGSLKLWGRLLNGLQVEKNNELLWSRLSAADLAATGTDPAQNVVAPSGLDDIVGELIVGLPNAKLLAVFCEESPQETRVILYSLKNINALDCLKEYAPRGLAQRAEATVRQSLPLTIEAILAGLRAKLDKLNS